MSIRKKLTMLLIISSTLPLIFFLVLNFYFSKNAATENALNKNYKTSQIIKEKINGIIENSMGGLKVLARDPAVRSLDVNKIKPVLAEDVKLYPYINSMVVTNSSGQQIVRSDDNSSLSNVADRSFYKKAIKGNEDVVSEILISKGNGKLIAVLANPIRTSEKGDIVGVIQGTMELSIMKDFVKELSSKDVTVYILDSTGKMIADPTKDFKSLDERTDMSKYDFVKSGLSGNNGSVEVTKDGTTKLISYVKDKKTGWLICSEISKNVAIKSSINSSILTAVIGIVILAITCILVFFILGKGTKPITVLADAANDISEGNLSIKSIDISSKDELGILSKSFEKMVSNLRDMVINIKDYSQRVSDSSNEMVSVSEQQSIAATNTANNTNEVSQGIENVHLSIDNINSNVANLDRTMDDMLEKSKIVSNAIKHASSSSELGSTSLTSVTSSMNNIYKSVNSTAVVIKKLDEYSKSIGEITNVIKSISEQTNLLALNAAIEAARAGEQGKGFAVVADEVRKLAEQSGEAAEQVSKIVIGIQDETNIAVEVMDKSMQDVSEGVSVIDKTNEYFSQIFNSIDQIKTSMEAVNSSINFINKEEKDINSSLKNMIKLSGKVTGEIENISAATEEQVASIEEMTASAQELGNMAVDLNSLTKKFKTE
ncbi:methyl-accepting chemotaxis protein [Clostridium felsineum]|uniref:methyl-accepting chemotaxis protein n=1 Tax=Clostridium felsineum TaxID=36839 RepID=UPI00098C9DB7|nr:methyl-accepting chemotaxis protein [Clostridium felsineum]URZ16617.1 Methyl-accepting chemotaxis protein McpB [Clostridium felsineum DSM 794]